MKIQKLFQKTLVGIFFLFAVISLFLIRRDQSLDLCLVYLYGRYAPVQ